MPKVSICPNQVHIRIPNSYLEFLIQFLESKFSFSADILQFYVRIYNSKTLIWILNTVFEWIKT